MISWPSPNTALLLLTLMAFTAADFVCDHTADWPDGIDQGCTKQKPICFGAERWAWFTPNQGLGVKCVKCVGTNSPTNDYGCPMENHWCATKTWKPLAGFGDPGDRCAKCINSPSFYGDFDVACSDIYPRCMRTDGSAVQPDFAGDMCAPRNGCTNDKQWPTIDSGCTKSKRICITEGIGSNCIKCLNSDKGGGQDTGCWKKSPFCVTQDWEEVTSAFFPAGQRCAKCKNNKKHDFVKDRGCTADKPKCVAGNGSDIAQGKYGKKCVRPPCQACVGGSGPCQQSNGMCWPEPCPTGTILCDPVDLPDPVLCTGCVPPSSGYCQQENGVCWNLPCPTGAYPCY